MATKPPASAAVLTDDHAGHAPRTGSITREQLIDGLNQDLAREYQAIIAYVVYSQVIKGPEYMGIAAELEKHAHEELAHALTITKQIDFLGGMPTVVPKSVMTSTSAREMLKADLDNENETVRHYRDRVRQAEALGEYALAEHLREILVQEQEHQIDLMTALGSDAATKPMNGPPAHPVKGNHHGSPETDRTTPR